MSLNLLTGVFGACCTPNWSADREAVELVVETKSISFETLRELEKCEVFAERLTSESNSKIQSAFNSGKPGELPKGTQFMLRLPRIVSGNVVAKDLKDLLSIASTTYQTPKAYYLVSVEDSSKPFCFTEQSSLSAATPYVRRYHDAVALWGALEAQAEHSVLDTRNILFFGIRRTELSPKFTIAELREGVALTQISGFINESDRQETRKEIFQSVISEFLQDQKADRAFGYLLRQSALFARRLKEGLAIFLSEHSPEKLAQEAQSRYLKLAEQLERIVGGMEAKSLSIPAAVLFAVKEAEIGARFTTLNFVIIIATFLYLITMLIMFLSQRVILNTLKTTITKTTGELKEKGLDERNPILADSFAKLESRRRHTQIGSRFILTFSFVPLLVVVYSVFWATPPTSHRNMIELTSTNSIQIIQSPNIPVIPMTEDTNPEQVVDLPKTVLVPDSTQ